MVESGPQIHVDNSSDTGVVGDILYVLLPDQVGSISEKLQKQLQQSEQLEIRLNNERFEEMKRLKADFMNEIHKSNSIHEQLEQ